MFYCWMNDIKVVSYIPRLRGLKYTTWEDDRRVAPVEIADGQYSGPAHHKFR